MRRVALACALLAASPGAFGLRGPPAFIGCGGNALARRLAFARMEPHAPMSSRTSPQPPPVPAQSAARGEGISTADCDSGDDGVGADPGVGVVSWRERITGSIARSRKVRGGNYVQIATVDEAGRPHCRTVVFRGFLGADKHGFVGSGGADAMKMITDGRSAKAAQIAANPACEMVWWFAKSSEQYRIEGELQLVGAPGSEAASVGAGAGHDLLVSARKEQWGQLSDPAREQFFWNGPGPYSGAVEVPAGGRNAETGAVLEAPPSFLLMLLHPTRVHYLRLTDNFAQVDELVAGGASGPRQWAARRVNP